MRTDEEIRTALKILNEYLRVTIEYFNISQSPIFMTRGHELEIMINVIENDRSPGWVYQNTLNSEDKERTVEEDNILYHSGIKAMEWRMKMGGHELMDLL